MKNILIRNINLPIKSLIPKELIIDGFNIADDVAENLYEYGIISKLNKECNLMLFVRNQLRFIVSRERGFLNIINPEDEIFAISMDSDHKLRYHYGWSTLETLVEARKRGLIPNNCVGGEIFKKVFRVKN